MAVSQPVLTQDLIAAVKDRLEAKGPRRDFVDIMASEASERYGVTLTVTGDSPASAVDAAVSVLGSDRGLLVALSAADRLLESESNSEPKAKNEFLENPEDKIPLSSDSPPELPDGDESRENPYPAPLQIPPESPDKVEDDHASESEELVTSDGHEAPSRDSSPDRGRIDTAPPNSPTGSADAHSDRDSVESDTDDDFDEDGYFQSALDIQPNLRKCLARQAYVVACSLKDCSDLSDQPEPITVESVQHQIERFVFNPHPSTPVEHREVRFNFYPPFLLPKAICNYHIFCITAPIPRSCKANRSGTALLEACRVSDYYKRLPKWRPSLEIDDGLGNEVTPIGELKEQEKLVPLKEDPSRLLWAKSRGDHVRYFSYPSLHFPPKLSRLLMEVLIQPFSDEGADPEPAMTDEELRDIVDPQRRARADELFKIMEKRRTMVTMAVRYCAELELMERLLREPSSVKKMQEVLHHTFHHGYVAVVRDIAKVNLSNYSTFHGITYNNPLNNCIVANLLEGSDKEDYVVDSIYLFLVLTWQACMGMWQHAIDETTLKMYEEALRARRRQLYSLTSVSDMSKALVDVLMDGDRLSREMRNAMPNFITQSQLSAFRHHLLERSNCPPFAAPFLPTDFIPLSFKQCGPVLWHHVYLLQVAFFLTRHGGYLWEPTENATASDRTYCPCNLCSPHRMPRHNVALHNEVLAIGTFEIRGPEGKTFKLTPELWTNAYLDRFVPKDFHPLTVHHYSDSPSSFSKDLRACVTDSPEILDLIRQIQRSREEFLLRKGKGTYKDPYTGDTLSAEQTCQRPLSQSGAGGPYQALPAPGSNFPEGVTPPPTTARPLRPSVSPDSGNGQLIQNHGPTHGRREDKGRGTPGSGVSNANVRGGGHRRRISRKPGYRFPVRGGGGGSAGAGAGGAGDGASTAEKGAELADAPQPDRDPGSEAPRHILHRGSDSA
ncbi:100K [Duck adenovirus 4]|uniref:100K n=1 Tax=Duck adenovirus 4 TaxID=2726020 RepID=A0A6M3Q900_9ADEN|nr:100K [Duck adenovirus 4]